MASRKPMAVGADGHPQAFQSPDVIQLPVFTVVGLPTIGISAGSKAYASNGRAMTGVSILGIGGLLVEAAGYGTGVEVTFNGSAWKITGTALTVSS